MFCENCGKKINTGTAFCPHCGNSIGKNSSDANIEVQVTPSKTSASHINNANSSSEKSWWYRLFQVIYFIIFSITVLAILAGAYSVVPKQVIDDEQTIINCTNGKSYNLSKSYIYLTQEPNPFVDTEISSLCSYGNTYAGNTNTNNYTLNITYKTQGNWDTVVDIGLFGLAVAIFILYLIRCAFKYIFLELSFSPN